MISNLNIYLSLNLLIILKKIALLNRDKKASLINVSQNVEKAGMSLKFF